VSDPIDSEFCFVLFSEFSLETLNNLFFPLRLFGLICRVYFYRSLEGKIEVISVNKKAFFTALSGVASISVATHGRV
jgi:hypothetical protein